MSPRAGSCGDAAIALLEAAASVDVRPTITDQFGERYVLEFQMRGPTGAAVVIST